MIHNGLNDQVRLSTPRVNAEWPPWAVVLDKQLEFNPLSGTHTSPTSSACSDPAPAMHFPHICLPDKRLRGSSTGADSTVNCGVRLEMTGEANRRGIGLDISSLAS